MKPSSQSPRTPSRLSESVHRQLNMYALAASVAGVGMFALVQEAEAKIVYTPAHKRILVKQKLGLDLNHDKVVDFVLSNGQGFSGSYWKAYLEVSAHLLGNEVVGFRTGEFHFPFASAGPSSAHRAFPAEQWYGGGCGSAE